MSSEEEAKNTLLALKGRTFDGHIVDVKYFPVSQLHTQPPDFSECSTPLVVTAVGPLPLAMIIGTGNNALGGYGNMHSNANTSSMVGSMVGSGSSIYGMGSNLNNMNMNNMGMNNNNNNSSIYGNMIGANNMNMGNSGSMSANNNIQNALLSMGLGYNTNTNNTTVNNTTSTTSTLGNMSTGNNNKIIIHNSK